MPEVRDHYKVLQVDPEAELEVIQAAYRRLAQKYHPDVTADPEAAARMSAINEAWSVLRDAGQRAAYDARRRSAGAASPGDARSEPGDAPGAGAASDAGGATAGASRQRPPDSAQRPPEETSPEWGTGRSTFGSTYDPGTMHRPEGHGAAGPPPGDPSGSLLTFGRYAGWSLGEIGRRDVDYLEWLDRMPIGRPYREEIDQLLRRAGRRRTAAAEDSSRRGLFRRR
ncbi:MAG TPA: J domain-containing protein [Candidatus Limnocylindrales bacterium]|nr:J domain-containing protein [Candidatus Limnocylindrales bacterium]